MSESFPIGSIPPLLLELCRSIHRSSLSKMTSTISGWVIDFCHHLFPPLSLSRQPVPSLYPRIKRNNSELRNHGYNLGPSSLTTVVRALTLLQPSTTDEWIAQSNSPRIVDRVEDEGFWEDFRSSGISSMGSEDKSESHLSFDLSTYCPKFELQPTSSLLIADDSEHQEEHQNTPLFHNDMSQSDSSKSIEDLRKIALRVIPICSDLLLFNVDKGRLMSVPMIASDIQNRIDEYSFKSESSII